MATIDKEQNFILLEKVLQLYSYKELADLLYVNLNTIKRWVSNKNVPWQFYLDLKKILNERVNFSELSYVEKDQFFTSPLIAKNCVERVEIELKKMSLSTEDFTLLEPSAGDGSFFNVFPHEDKIGLDIEPKNDNIVQKDFLEWYPTKTNKPYITLGNPPFGLRGNLALRFINHAAKFSDFVCFILPPLFDSDGKGNCKDRVKDLNLIYSEPIDNSFYYPDGEKISINVIFQIWSKNYKKVEGQKKSCGEYLDIYSLTDGGTPATTRNKHMLNNCDYYIASSSFEKEKIKLYDSFEELPNRRGYGIKIKKDYERVSKIIENIDWPSKSFISTNSSYNIRTSKIVDAIIEMSVKN